MRRLLVPLIIVVVLIGVGVVLGLAVSGSGGGGSQESNSFRQLVTVQMVITATTDPNATVPVVIITATPLPGSIWALPTGILGDDDTTSNTNATRAAAPTLDPEILGADSALQQTVTALPENCILHTVETGDTPFGVAEIYGASGFDLMEVNGLDDFLASRLQIGDVLIVPLEGCTLTARDLATEAPAVAQAQAGTDTPDAEATAEVTDEPEETPTPSPSPTMTLPPTAVNAQVEIVQVIAAGDITAEGVEIRNRGNVVDLTGWTLEDSQGNVYTFPEQRLFTNGSVTIYTRTGTDTPIARYWGRSQAVWGESGETVTLYNASRVAQSSLRLADAINLP